jgi:hypothetical protein
MGRRWFRIRGHQGYQGYRNLKPELFCSFGGCRCGNPRRGAEGYWGYRAKPERDGGNPGNPAPDLGVTEKTH